MLGYLWLALPWPCSSCSPWSRLKPFALAGLLLRDWLCNRSLFDVPDLDVLVLWLATDPRVRKPLGVQETVRKAACSSVLASALHRPELGLAQPAAPLG